MGSIGEDLTGDAATAVAFQVGGNQHRAFPLPGALAGCLWTRTKLARVAYRVGIKHKVCQAVTAVDGRALASPPAIGLGYTFRKVDFCHRSVELRRAVACAPRPLVPVADRRNRPLCCESASAARAQRRSRTIES